MTGTRRDRVIAISGSKSLALGIWVENIRALLEKGVEP
jgi:hypothetical protein